MEAQFNDRLLTCADCHAEFVFTAGEQLFFSEKQFKNDPKRCKPCKSRRSGLAAAASGLGPASAGLCRTETRTECSECGVETTVPFKPTQGRPVLCRQCFQTKGRAVVLQPAAVHTPAPMLLTETQAVSALTDLSANSEGAVLSPEAAVLAVASMASASRNSGVATAADLASIAGLNVAPHACTERAHGAGGCRKRPCRHAAHAAGRAAGRLTGAPPLISSMHPAARAADSDLQRGRLSFGDFELTVCTDGTYLLDGGAMFGVVPKTLWAKRAPADEDNRILLGLNTVVVRTGSAVVLIETGIGNKQSAKMQAIHRNQALLPASLAACGVRPEEVTHVINTHLHFDHCGWNTTLHLDGRVTPTFPNARYLAHRGEVEHGRLQLERDAVSYLAPNYEPLLASGQMTLLDTRPGEVESILPGIAVELFPGHTAQMLGVHVESPGPFGTARHACYIGDLLPTTHHLDPTWVMGYDLDPLTTIAERKRFLARAIPEQWLVLFTHDHHTPAATVGLNDRGKPVATPVLEP